jgi:16S rRNA processing protein RimM
VTDAVQSSREIYVTVGQLGKTYGLQGWLKVNSFTDPMDNLLDYSPLYFKQEEQWSVLPITEMRLHANSIVAHIQGYDTPESARLLTGTELAIHRSQLPKLAKDEFFWCDLVGMNVVTCSGVELGKVDSLLRAGGNDILVVKGAKEHLIPLVRNHFVMKIDAALQQITVDWDPEF